MGQYTNRESGAWKTTKRRSVAPNMSCFRAFCGLKKTHKIRNVAGPGNPPRRKRGLLQFLFRGFRGRLRGTE